MAQYNFEKRHFVQNNASISFTAKELEYMRSLRWYQVIPFSEEVVSPGCTYPTKNPAKYFLDKLSLQGQSILGIGCYEGFQLYVAEGKGAGKVVGIVDDFGLYPSIDAARQFTREKLNSKVELISIPVDQISPENVGYFDVVFFFDALPHLRHPLLTFEKVATVAKSVLLVTSPFVLSNFNVPWVSHLQDHEKQGFRRNYTITNAEWILHCVEDLGFELGAKKIWEYDYCSVAAAKLAVQSKPSVPISELPDDAGKENQTAVFVVSCAKYQEAWEPFFKLFKKYWPDCPYKVYLLTDHGRYPGIETIELGEDQHWASNCLDAFAKVPEERILLFQEDFFLISNVNTAVVRKLVRHSLDFDVGCMRLYPVPGPTGRWHSTDYLGTIGPFDDFRFSFQLSLWKKSLYTSLLVRGEDPWTTEFVGARRSVFSKEPFLGVLPINDLPIPYLGYAIDSGEWQPHALERLKQEGFDISKLSKRVGRKSV